MDGRPDSVSDTPQLAMARRIVTTALLIFPDALFGYYTAIYLTESFVLVTQTCCKVSERRCPKHHYHTSVQEVPRQVLAAPPPPLPTLALPLGTRHRHRHCHSHTARCSSSIAARRRTRRRTPPLPVLALPFATTPSPPPLPATAATAARTRHHTAADRYRRCALIHRGRDPTSCS